MKGLGSDKMMSIIKELQFNFPKMRGGSMAVRNFSKNSSDLVAGSFPKRRIFFYEVKLLKWLSETPDRRCLKVDELSVCVNFSPSRTFSTPPPPSIVVLQMNFGCRLAIRSTDQPNQPSNVLTSQSTNESTNKQNQLTTSQLNNQLSNQPSYQPTNPAARQPSKPTKPKFVP